MTRASLSARDARRASGPVALAAFLLAILVIGALVVASGERPSLAGEPPTSAPAAGSPPADLEAAIERTAPSIVSVQILLKFEGGEQQISWAHGAIVDPTGLVMLSGGDVGGGDAKLADVKVLLGSDPKEWSAVLVARDKTLDLAYIQILGLGDKRLPAVDLVAGKDARKVEPRLGEPLYGVTRMGRGFDYAPAVRKIYFICRIESPRRLWDIAGAVDAGLPVFDMAGNAVAVLSNQASAEGADEYGGSSADLFALPLDPVIRSLEQARKRVPDAVKKAEASKKDGECEAPAPKDPKDSKDPSEPEGPKEPSAPKGPKPGEGEPRKPPTPAPDAPAQR